MAISSTEASNGRVVHRSRQFEMLASRSIMRAKAEA